MGRNSGGVKGGAGKGRGRKPKTKPIEFQTTWHKVNSPMAMTYNQKSFIDSLSEKTGNLEGWDFRSSTNAMRSIDKFTASAIIDALKSGKKVKIV